MKKKKSHSIINLDRPDSIVHINDKSKLTIATSHRALIIRGSSQWPQQWLRAFVRLLQLRYISRLLYYAVDGSRGVPGGGLHRRRTEKK